MNLNGLFTALVTPFEDGGLDLDALTTLCERQLVFPYYNKPNPAGLRAHVEACCRVGLPIVLYHVPGRTGQHLEPAVVAALSEPVQIVGVKEATGDVDYGQELMRHTDVAVLSGDDFTAAPLISMGATGVISVVSNVAPRQTKALVTAAASGDAETMRTLQQQLLPLIRYLFSDSNPVGAKAALAEMGLCKNELRLPLAPGIPPSAQLVAGVE
jgi:4-hydroxy-tetrahydrodipicolinate synthase